MELIFFFAVRTYIIIRKELRIMFYSEEMLDEFEKKHGYTPFQKVPRHSGRYPWRTIQPEELPPEVVKQELERLRDKGRDNEYISKRTGIDIYIVAEVLKEA
jgi:hypothetical protein